MAHLLFLCTGNAARSVMAGAMCEAVAPGLTVETAGTHVIDGQPMSRRTWDALAGHGLQKERHRSAQARPDSIVTADLVVAMAREHVLWVRRTHPEAAARTATIKRLVRDLPPSGPLGERVAALGLADVELEDWEDVDDPAGGAPEVYVACAAELHDLVGRLAQRVTGRASLEV